LLIQNLETELIYCEFCEVLIWFLFKRVIFIYNQLLKEKDLNSSKEDEISNRLTNHINNVASSMSDFGKLSNKKAPRIWPESEKDTM